MSMFSVSWGATLVGPCPLYKLSACNCCISCIIFDAVDDVVDVVDAVDDVDDAETCAAIVLGTHDILGKMPDTTDNAVFVKESSTKSL